MRQQQPVTNKNTHLVYASVLEYSCCFKCIKVFNSYVMFRQHIPVALVSISLETK